MCEVGHRGRRRGLDLVFLGYTEGSSWKGSAFLAALKEKRPKKEAAASSNNIECNVCDDNIMECNWSTHSPDPKCSLFSHGVGGQCLVVARFVR